MVEPIPPVEERRPGSVSVPARSPRHSRAAWGRFDPRQARGAWIFLCASVGLGAWLGSGQGVERALLAGTGFVGAFMAVSAVGVGVRRRQRQALVGASLAVCMPLTALLLDRDPRFLIPAGGAAFLAIATLYRASQQGFLAADTIVLGTATLTLAAPVSAFAGGAGMFESLVVYGLLWPFCSWRTIRVAADLPAQGPWDPGALRARGLREAAFTAAWALLVALAVPLL